VIPSVSTMNNDKIIDRDQLQDNLIHQILDDMDIKTMMAILYDSMSEDYDKYSVDELITEVEEFYPHLLPETNVSELEATANNYTTGK
jgi:arginine/lysine/ornithine decarboxylase